MRNPVRRRGHFWVSSSLIAFLGSFASVAPRAAAPGPVGNTLQLGRGSGPGETTINWDAIPAADYYNTYVGTIPGSGMGSRGPGGYEIVTASGGGGQFAQCPGSKRVIGGGAEGSSSLWASRPEPPGTGWYASAGGPFVVAYAICADIDDSYEIVSQSGTGGQLVPCPGSKRVLGGGADGTALLWASRPEPPGTGWYASAGGAFVFAYAICADVSASYAIVSLSGGAGQFARCPGASKVVGGGADGTAQLWSSRPEPPGIGWYASAGGAFVIDYAICIAAPYDHTCYEIGDAIGDGPTVSTLGMTPPVGTVIYVLVSGANSSGEGPLGEGVADDGSPISRTSSTPCPTPP